MTSDSAFLLKQLEPVVRPAYAGGSPAPAAPFDSRSFDELLALARQGRVESGRALSVSFDGAADLSDAQHTRLSAAADLAEASGAQRALLLLDGRGLVLEVATRTLSAELSGEASSRLVNLEAAVYVAGADEDAAPAVGPPGGVAPRGVAEQIEAAARSRLTISH